MSAYEKLSDRLMESPRVWLVTGAAGFIGSNLVETLLRLNQRVIGLDNYSTGSRRNLHQVQALVGQERWRKFHRIDGDTRDLPVCQRASEGADYVLHQAGLGSVPRSIAGPLESHASNVTGFLNVLLAARDSGAKRLVFASSSSVYGDYSKLPKVEAKIGRCLSPYAATKRVNEIYADVFARCYGLQSVGLRYFNVFGPRQDPGGAYSAVVPRWISALIRNEPVRINGDGKTSRDFCYVENVVQANLLAATVDRPEAINELYNVAVGDRITLNQLYALLRKHLLPWFPHLERCRPEYRPFRAGDIRHSEADISKAQRLLDYQPTHTVEQGLVEALGWYLQNVIPKPVRAGRPTLPRRGVATVPELMSSLPGAARNRRPLAVSRG